MCLRGRPPLNQRVGVGHKSCHFGHKPCHVRTQNLSHAPPQRTCWRGGCHAAVPPKHSILCQRTTVSGWTITSTDCQPLQNFRSNTQSRRSRGQRFGRFPDMWSTASCRRTGSRAPSRSFSCAASVIARWQADLLLEGYGHVLIVLKPYARGDD